MKYADFLKTYFPEDFVDQLIKAQEGEAISGLRINRSKCHDLGLFRMLEKHPFVKQAYLFDKNIHAFGKSVYHQAGLYYIQEPSAMLVAELLNIKDDDYVLDLCAAPGGKATHAAQFLTEDGLLVANDYNYKRALALQENIERMGIKNAIILNNDVKKLAEKYQGVFNKVILDAPCSGEGMFRKSEEVSEDWSLEKVHRLAKLQKELILKAYKLLKKGGILIYSTCTFNPLENEEVVKELLTKTQASLISLPEVPNSKRGLELKEALRLFPTDYPWEGHFIALLRCNDEHQRFDLKVNKSNIDNQSLKLFNDFVRLNLNLSFDKTRLYKIQNSLYYQPKNSLNTDQLKVLRLGLKLGDFKSKHFVPSHSLALASQKKDWQKVLELNKEETQQYLKGLTFTHQADDGYALVTYNSYILGFAKIVQNQLKNHYPKALRRDVIL